MPQLQVLHVCGIHIVKALGTRYRQDKGTKFNLDLCTRMGTEL